MSDKNAALERDDAFYERLSRAVEAHQYEVSGPAEYGPAHMERGRPSRGRKNGPSPARAIRLPESLDAALEAKAAETGLSISEVMRQALAEYLHVGA